MRIGSSVSDPAEVLSGVIQGSVVGPGLFSVVLDSLLCRLSLPSVAFVDDVKMVANLEKHCAADIQTDLDIIGAWSEDYKMPLSVEKSAVLHYGPHNPEHMYTIQGSILQSTDSMRDLGVTRSIEGGFNQHIAGVASSASRMAVALSRVFQQRPAVIPWFAFKSYVLPILMYSSPVWSLTSAWEKAALKGVMRRFTKRLSGLGQLSYAEHLSTLNAFSLEVRGHALTCQQCISLFMVM